MHRIDRVILTMVATAAMLAAIVPPATFGQSASPAALFDFGDAPDPTFPSLLGSDGARTADPTPFWLGGPATPGTTVEPDAQVIDLDAGDDGLVRVLATAGKVFVTFQATRSTLAPGGIAWFNLLADSDGDGRWGGPVPTQPLGEWIVTNRPVDLAPGATATIDATVPLVGGNLEVWLRATITDTPVTGVSWDGTGSFAQGEVEDHRVGPEDVWDVSCDPDPLVIDHGGAGAIIIVDQSGTATELEVQAVTGSLGLLGDPNAADLSVVPGPRAGPVGIGAGISVTSTNIHGFPDMTIGVSYSVDVSVRGPLGVKTLSCTVVVNHAGFVLLTTEDGTRIVYTGPRRVRRRAVLEATFQVATADGRPATGTLRGTLGDPPSDRQATHAAEELDGEGKATLRLDVDWPVGMTQLYVSWADRVYPLTTIRIDR